MKPFLKCVAPSGGCCVNDSSACSTSLACLNVDLAVQLAESFSVKHHHKLLQNIDFLFIVSCFKILILLLLSCFKMQIPLLRSFSRTRLIRLTPPGFVFPLTRAALPGPLWDVQGRWTCSWIVASSRTTTGGCSRASWTTSARRASSGSLSRGSPQSTR